MYIEHDCLDETERLEERVLLKDVKQEVIDKVIRLVHNSEFKRHQAPPIIRVQYRAFGVGRQIPIVAVQY